MAVPPLRLLALMMPLMTLPASADQRSHLDATLPPWTAIGRLNIAGRGHCTAVLISESHILTAAHCLWNRVSGDWWPLDSVHFVPGYQGGEAPLHALAAKITIADGLHFDERFMPEPRGADWALITLTEPLGRQAGWLKIRQDGPQAGDRLGVIGYRAESAHAMSLDEDCRLQPAAGPLIWSDCAIARGESGGPLLALGATEPKLLGIQSVISQNNGHWFNGAIDIRLMLDVAQFPQAARQLRSALTLTR